MQHTFSILEKIVKRSKQKGGGEREGKEDGCLPHFLEGENMFADLFW